MRFAITAMRFFLYFLIVAFMFSLGALSLSLGYGFASIDVLCCYLSRGAFSLAPFGLKKYLRGYDGRDVHQKYLRGYDGRDVHPLRLHEITAALSHASVKRTSWILKNLYPNGCDCKFCKKQRRMKGRSS